MLILKKVAVTGGLSSGKSTVCQIFRELGAFVVSADIIVHRLLSPQSPLAPQLIQLLGEGIKKDQEFDRNEIAKRVFADHQTLKELESILHPAILEEVERQYDRVKNQNHHTLFIAEIPLLYEIESQHLFDSVIAVTCDDERAKQRFKKRTEQPDEEFDRRMSHQLPPSEKTANADHIIENNGTLAELRAQVETLYQKLTQE